MAFSLIEKLDVPYKCRLICKHKMSPQLRALSVVQVVTKISYAQLGYSNMMKKLLDCMNTLLTVGCAPRIPVLNERDQTRLKYIHLLVSYAVFNASKPLTGIDILQTFQSQMDTLQISTEGEKNVCTYVYTRVHFYYVHTS